MKIAEGIVEFILHLLKSVILLAIIGAAACFALFVITIFKPDAVIQAVDIWRGLFS